MTAYWTSVPDLVNLTPEANKLQRPYVSGITEYVYNFYFS